MGADGGVADESAVVHAYGDGPVLVPGVAEGEGFAGQESCGDPLRGGCLPVRLFAVPLEDSAGDAEATQREPPETVVTIRR
ncbi:hypothetical protein OG909_12430 [Streptomyces sp. NBC_01754]|nr:hypothetical protein OG909_12430 [Streptomyces sp. NBC_01754]